MAVLHKEKHEANWVVNEEISSLKVKRKHLLEHCSVLQDSAEKLAECAEKEDDMVHLRKSNSFRRTIKDMEKEADEIDDHIETLKKRLKMLPNWRRQAVKLKAFPSQRFSHW